MKSFFRLCRCALLLSIFLTIAGTADAQQLQTYKTATTATGSPLEGLQSKINEVVTLKNGLEKKLKEMQSARTEYQNEIAQLKKEIDSERESNKIDDYKKALKNKRIHNNLSLIQRQLAYIDKITKLEYTISQGIEEMLYLERKAKADLKIVKLLDNKDELVQKIDNSLKNYAPYATKFALDSKRLNFLPLEKIWKEMSPKVEPPVREEKKQESLPLRQQSSNISGTIAASEKQAQHVIEIEKKPAKEKQDSEIVQNQPVDVSTQEVFTVEGKYFWRSAPHYGHFTLIKDGDSYKGYLDDEREGTYGDRISYVSISGKYIRFKRNGRYGIQYWEGEFVEVNSKLISIKGCWKKINGGSGDFYAEKKD